MKEINQKIYFGILCFISATVLWNAVAVFATDANRAAIFSGILGGLIGGGMTIFAGWLAFKEARKSNDANFLVQKKILLIETLKAINLVDNEIIKIYKQVIQIQNTRVGNLFLREIVSSPANFKPSETKKAATIISSMIPHLIDLLLVGDALVVLSLEVTRLVNEVNQKIGQLQDDFVRIYPTQNIIDENDLVWRNSLLTVYGSGSLGSSNLTILREGLESAHKYLDKLRVKHSDEYNKIFSSFFIDNS